MELKGDYTEGCGKEGVYFIKEDHELTADETESAIVITGDVTLIFVISSEHKYGPRLDVSGGDAVRTKGAGAGIELNYTTDDKYNYLTLKGVGELYATGGKGAAGETGTNGDNSKKKVLHGFLGDNK